MPLKNIPRLLTPELLHALASMGHGDEILICDANFPSSSQGVKHVIHCEGSNATDVLTAVLELIPLDSFVRNQAAVMKQVDSEEDAPIVADFFTILNSAYHQDGAKTDVSIQRLERHAFYDRATTVFAICVTGESRLYGNIVVKKGVIGENGKTVLASDAASSSNSKRLKSVDTALLKLVAQKDQELANLLSRLSSSEASSLSKTSAASAQQGESATSRGRPTRAAKLAAVAAIAAPAKTRSAAAKPKATVRGKGAASADIDDNADSETSRPTKRSKKGKSNKTIVEEDESESGESEEPEDDSESSNEGNTITLFSAKAFQHKIRKTRQEEEEERRKRSRKSLNSLSVQQQLALALERSMNEE